MVLRGTTRYCEALQDITRYCEWYYGSLRGTTRQTLREVLQDTKSRGTIYCYRHTVALQERLDNTRPDN